MSRKYGHYCALATALDVVGERWTLLVVRELLGGPLRFGQLKNELPGIPGSLLSARLQGLMAYGVVEQLDGHTYGLTPLGYGLTPALGELARWGLHFIEEQRPDDAFHPRWIQLALHSMFRPGNGESDGPAVYEFRVEGYIFHLIVEGKTLRSVDGPAGDPDLLVKTDAYTLVRIASGRLRPAEALDSGLVKIMGEREEFDRCVSLFMEAGDTPIPYVGPDGHRRRAAVTKET
ncbi:MAG: transcriptional regulator [Microbispora sp.]|nr:transcriptional regulator [Microbispora sp.]